MSGAGCPVLDADEQTETEPRKNKIPLYREWMAEKQISLNAFNVFLTFLVLKLIQQDLFYKNFTFCHHSQQLMLLPC